jgi:hypothetical protein
MRRFLLLLPLSVLSIASSYADDTAWFALGLGTNLHTYDAGTADFVGKSTIGPTFDAKLYWENLFFEYRGAVTTISTGRDIPMGSSSHLYPRGNDLNPIDSGYFLGYHFSHPLPSAPDRYFWHVDAEPFAGVMTSSFVVPAKEKLDAGYQFPSVIGFGAGLSLLFPVWIAQGWSFELVPSVC